LCGSIFNSFINGIDLEAEMTWSNVFVSYWKNLKTITGSCNNPLKKTENLALKDRQEQLFYDAEAQKHINHFDEAWFLYDEHEKMPSSHCFFYSLVDQVRNKKVLDLCCGYGFTSVRLAKRGAHVTGIDISPKMVKLAQRNAELNKVTDRVCVQKMSAQAMDFPDNSFNYVIGIGALHHLNIDTAGREISRVLKKGGRAFFIEPRIPYKWLIIIRSILPSRCFESPGGAQLSDHEIKSFSNFFADTKISYFLLLRKFARFPFLNKIPDKLDEYDRFLVEHFPILKKLCWAVVLQFEK
jgi:ubiquinone/menaquinone biosynthesis C-methylase UbiE